MNVLPAQLQPDELSAAPGPMKPLVSVIIPTYNSSLWLHETLQSILRQSYPRERIELIVVDDASQDDTVAVAGSFLRQHGLDGDVIASKQNVGVGASRNIAWKQAKGDWIQFVDHDDVLAPIRSRCK